MNKNGELRKSKQDMKSGYIWCPYIPVFITPVIKTTRSKILSYKFEKWFYNLCLYSKLTNNTYISECLKDLYFNYGKPERLFLLDPKFHISNRKKIATRYANKKINGEFYSKITIK